MLLGWFWLTACGLRSGAPPAETDEGPAVFSVEIAARVGEVGPASWAARATWGPQAPAAPLGAGECRPAGSARARAPRGARGVDGVAIRGPMDARFDWKGELGTWTVEGPREALDPAWSIGDLRWSDERGEHRAEGVVRFAGVPKVEAAVREREGDVRLAWDPSTVHEASVLVAGPGGLLECGVSEGGVRLPWWAVPAHGGEVILRTSRDRVEVVNEVFLRVRTTIERPIPLDLPAWTTAGDEAPAFEPYSPHGPRRLYRKARTPVG